ncbi:MAG: hypothetical protein ACQEQU_04595 [Spirochaetota bacterium]
MSKKLVIVLLALLLALPTSLFAADLIGLRIGPAAMIGGSLDENATNYILDDNFVKDAWPDGYSFGADARFNFSLLEVNALALLSSNDSANTTELDVYANAGTSISLLNFLRVGASAGPLLNVTVGDDVSVEEQESLMDLGLNLRLTGDIELGDLSLGLSAIFETGATVNKIKEDGFKNAVGDQVFEEGLFGVSAMFALF